MFYVTSANQYAWRPVDSWLWIGWMTAGSEIKQLPDVETVINTIVQISWAYNEAE